MATEEELEEGDREEEEEMVSEETVGGVISVSWLLLACGFTFCIRDIRYCLNHRDDIRLLIV
jgi:hypothetical protein